MTDAIKPLGSWTLVRLVQGPRQTAGGLHVPDSAKSVEGVARARVYAKGPGVKHDYQPGAIVLVGQATVYPVLHDGTQYLLVNEDGIVGIDHGYQPEDPGLVVLQ